MLRALGRIFLQEDVNFLLTNRIPRRLATRFMGWFSRIEHPLVRVPSLFLWRRCADLRLHEAEKAQFSSIRDCFTRRLRPGARPVDRDPRVLASPCDAIVGAFGAVGDGTVAQAKSLRYRLADLLQDATLADRHRGGFYVTLRLTASMYHRFHAPYDCRIERVTHLWGDTWNVNPIALARIERLFCRNERAVIEARLPDGAPLTLVPVAAILVAGIRLGFLDRPLRPARPGPSTRIACDVGFEKGAEIGWFEHGSTIVLLAPPGWMPGPDLRSGAVIRMGEPLLRAIGQRRCDCR